MAHTEEGDFFIRRLQTDIISQQNHHALAYFTLLYIIWCEIHTSQLGFACSATHWIYYLYIMHSSSPSVGNAEEPMAPDTYETMKY